jgi:hypothetical protein
MGMDSKAWRWKSDRLLECGGRAQRRHRFACARGTAISLRTEMVGRSVLAEPLNRLSAHRDGFALPSEYLKLMAVVRGDAGLSVTPGGSFRSGPGCGSTNEVPPCGQ